MSSHLFDEYCFSWKWTTIAGVLLLGLGSKVLFRPSDLISHILNVWLCWKHPIKSTEAGRSLPTVPYRFPNGQGDSAKFLYGKENSLKWEKKHGQIYRIWSGRTPEVVLTQAAHIQEAFKDSDKHIKAVNNNSGYYMGQLLGKCVGLISGNEWKRVRTVCERPFFRPVSGSYIECMQRKTVSHFDELRKHSKLSECIIDPAQDLKYLPFWIVAEIIYGQLSKEMEQELKVMAPKREKLFKYVIGGGLPRFTWSKYLPTSANRELHEFRRDWLSFNRRAREQAIRRSTNTSLVQMYQAVDSTEISEEQLLQTIDEMLYANLDVTLGGISWNLVYLAAYPEAQARLRAEIGTRRQESEAGFNAYILESSTYLASCISESSRLRPLAAFSVPQAIPTGRFIGGYYFPPKTNFVIDSHALNQRNPYWGKDSSRFRADRFFERTPVQARYNFWRFGFGPRQCMGKYVADVMIRILLIHLVEGFELGIMAENDEWKREPEVWINQPRMQLRCMALRSKDIIMAQFIPKQCAPRSPATMAELMGDVSVQIAHKTVAIAELGSGSTVLDNGCGNGVVTLAIINVGKPGDITIFATDLNLKMCEVTAAQAALQGWADSVTTAKMPAEALTFDDNFFSHSFTNFVIQASQDPAKVADSIYRTLKPGGTAIVTTWAKGAHIPAALAAHTATRGADAFHEFKKGKEWQDPAHLEGILKEARFTSIRIEQCNSIMAISDLKRWSLIAWSFFGGLADGGWTQADEGKFQQAVDTIYTAMLETEGVKTDGKGGVKFKMVANIAIARK
ncbi:Cytochrome P450 monooxygenase [Lachnellula hyalina]|uniref:Cytochrome P450 monooxygenase n=1 Tax=Lachnellula hyalina TaxID=1316788 RepID=A0A8H8QTW5_9HELO|nr:Cytochrome P450 monooxygenase [Lachnellula hyalina]TVY22563.1 Cytochrome P450 monooxygenase [Lachnellula hyalina]